MEGLAGHELLVGTYEEFVLGYKIGLLSLSFLISFSYVFFLSCH